MPEGVCSWLAAVVVWGRDPFAASLSTSHLHVYNRRPALSGPVSGRGWPYGPRNVGVGRDPTPFHTCEASPEGVGRRPKKSTLQGADNISGCRQADH
jgi:hypothetical protein